MLRRLALGVVAAAAVVLAADPAGAHVTIQPGEATQGGFATFAFQVPNERDDASTIQLQVEFPAEHPIPFVSVQPVPGWTIDVEHTRPEEAIESHGEEITEVVSTITWSGGAIAPGEFQQFLVSAGPLPEDTDHLTFKALQTYDDGEVVRWIQEAGEGGEEPEFPAPVLELTPGTGDEHGGTSEDATDEAATATDDDHGDDSTVLAIVALVVGGLGLIVGGTALVVSRRRTTSA